MKRLKKLVLPLRLVGMLALGSTSVFANEFNNVDNVIDKPTLYDALYKVNGTTLSGKSYSNYLELSDTHPYGKVHYYNASSNKVTIVVKIGGNKYTVEVSPYSGGYKEFSTIDGNIANIDINSSSGSLNGQVWIASASDPSDFQSRLFPN